MRVHCNSQTDNADSASGGQADTSFSCKQGKLSPEDVWFLLRGHFDTNDCEIIGPSSGAEARLVHKGKASEYKTNTFDEWKVNSECYPKLALLAQRVLSSPTTSVPAEHVFSTAGGTIIKLRAALDPELVDKFDFLNKQFKSLTVPSAEEKASSVAIKVESQETVTDIKGNHKCRSSDVPSSRFAQFGLRE